QGATKAQVIKTMKANGKPFSKEYDILHFLSIPDGAVNFQFENDKVMHIDGVTDDGQPPLQGTGLLYYRDSIDLAKRVSYLFSSSKRSARRGNSAGGSPHGAFGKRERMKSVRAPWPGA